ncbi:beta-N-acetylhexosaminidase [Sulfuriroseicoccus oceanibius]|uniref:beta-N-acetylhexosaminidase n=1 Tax=Sulfuriroseicoccus oceanibius TaxID=2707525 RepID=A0A6B3L3I2_9BACT|nr:beta-N-acetylhexosaminidase [Sulfuriroseicoccus oceanibius]QQL45634.1 beta-N-acetylhexosaminidase [Sulfuriroseicoccus oceanibius]
MIGRILPALAALWITCTLTATASIIPQPKEMTTHGDAFPLTSKLTVTTPAELEAIAESLEQWFTERAPATNAEQPPATTKVTLAIDTSGTLPAEGYRLETRDHTITITGADAAGVFYGVQSLKQLFSADEAATIPATTITDAPRFRWRGMHLDVSRHFYSVDEVKRFLDHMAAYKMNVFHWHLVDGPGWRIEIKRYPKLTEIGAWRKDKTSEPWNWQATEINPKGQQQGDYGGYYTQDQIREIVAYAKERFITVVPEIEMPGHSYAVLVAHPEFACPTNEILTEGLRGKDVFCVGNPGTTEFLQHILDEVLELFPSQYIHIGADEVPKSAWLECPKCTGLMKDQRLADGDALQSYFVKQMEAYLKSKGRTLIGWDEIIEGGLPEDAAVMVWRDANFAKSALEHGHPVVLCPNSHCYFDYYQTEDHNSVPPAIGGFTPTTKVYSFQPESVATNDAQRALILGVQGTVWTEYIQNMDHLEARIFPRMPALSEVAWSPADQRDFESFTKRLNHHKARWKAAGIQFYDGPLDGKQIKPKN